MIFDKYFNLFNRAHLKELIIINTKNIVNGLPTASISPTPGICTARISATRIWTAVWRISATRLRSIRIRPTIVSSRANNYCHSASDSSTATEQQRQRPCGAVLFTGNNSGSLLLLSDE